MLHLLILSKMIKEDWYMGGYLAVINLPDIDMFFRIVSAIVLTVIAIRKWWLMEKKYGSKQPPLRDEGGDE